MPRALTLAGRWYRLALLLYPAGFHQEFAADMARDFDEAGLDRWRAGGRRRLLSFWGSMTTDLLVSAARQWLRTGLPQVAVVSAALAIAAAGAAAQIVVVDPITPPAASHDRDLLMLLLLAATAFGVIVATIVFTLWSTRSLRRPPGRRGI